MRRIRVLYTIPELLYGGAERQLVELASRLDRTRYAPAIAVLRPGGPLEPAAREAGVEVIATPRRGRLDPRPAFRIADVARRRKVDVTHSFLFLDGFYGRVGAALAKVPVRIASLRGVDYAPGSRHSYADRLLQRITDCLVLNSRRMRRYARSCGLRQTPIVVIPNGVDVERAARVADREAVRHELGLSPKQVVFGFVGRLSPEKGVDLFLRCAARLAVRHREMACVIVGDGPERPRTERIIRELSLEWRVKLTGWRPDVARVLSGLDALALTSRSESFPNVVLEAMAAGLPVVSARVGDVPGIVREEETGLLAPVEDVEAITDAMRRLLVDADLRGRMGRAGRSRAEALFGVERMVRRYEALYERLLTEKRR